MRISVVLPVFNGGATIESAIDSLSRQSRRPDQIVVVDDGSTDGTAAILRRLARRPGARMTVVSTDHRGLVPALNTGLTHADGELIARMDADDVSLPHRLEIQEALCAVRPDLGVVGSAAVMPPRADNTGYRRYVDWVNGLSHWRQIRRARFVESPLIHPTVVFRRDLTDRYGAYRQGPFPEDYELWLRWFHAGVRAASVPRVLLTWNDPPSRFSRTPTAMQSRDAFFTIKARYLAAEVVRAAAGRDVLVWGAGRRTRRRMEPFDAALADSSLGGGHARARPVSAFIDLAPRDGVPFAGRRVAVIGYRELPSPNGAYIVAAVGSTGARGRIAAVLAAAGYRYERDWLAAA